jgi:hypothetical protein
VTCRGGADVITTLTKKLSNRWDEMLKDSANLISDSHEVPPLPPEFHLVICTNVVFGEKP